MKRLIKKIPITIWTLLLILACSYLIINDKLILDNTKLDTITKVLTIIGLYYLAIQVRNQTKSERISNEFLNQSNFDFSGFSSDTIKNAHPCLCCQPGTLNYNQCSDIHWFNFKQIGNLPAKELKMSLIHEKEKQDIDEILKKRLQEEPMVYKNDEHQFKLNPHLIPLSHFDPKVNGKFYVLIEYKSLYSNIRYKRIYYLNYSPTIAPTAVPTTWMNSIKYFSLCLEHLNDSETISWPDTLKNFGNRLLHKFNIKKTLSINEWLLDI